MELKYKGKKIDDPEEFYNKNCTFKENREKLILKKRQEIQAKEDKESTFQPEINHNSKK